MSNLRKLLMMDVGGAGLPEAVAFDDTNDYLSKTTSPISVNTKTFTFSGWAYITTDNTQERYILYGAGSSFIVYTSTTDKLTIMANQDPSLSVGLSAVATTDIIPYNTMVNILISCDMSDTGKRHVYVNDQAVTMTWSTYVDSLIKFDASTWYVARRTAAKSLYGRAAHLFLDTAYRDLSVEANRRLFINEDLTPASGQAGQTPPLYLPMLSADTAGDNAGTGGDFTVVGNPQTASRGPNQDNCVASDMNGSADYVNLNAALGLTSNKLITFAINFRADSGTSKYAFSTADGTTLHGAFYYSSAGQIVMLMRNSSSTNILYWASPTGTIAYGANHSFAFSADLSDTGKRHVYLDGLALTGTWITYTDDDIAWADVDRMAVGCLISGPSGYFAGAEGEVYFDNVYTDLSVANPFYDLELNKPISVRKTIENTGITPKAALPMIANDAGANLGSLADFTVNSGPFSGARGRSEFWSRSAVFPVAATDYLSSAAQFAASKSITFACSLKFQSANTNLIMECRDAANTGYALRFTVLSTGAFRVFAKNSAGTIIANITTPSSTLTNGNWSNILLSFNLADTGERGFVIDGVEPTMTYTVYTDDTMDIDNTVRIGYDTAPLTNLNIANVYCRTGYIDVTDPDVVDLFFDRLGFPRDLQPAIANELLADAPVRMAFDDPDDLAFNSGTGADFTLNGTLENGPDVGI